MDFDDMDETVLGEFKENDEFESNISVMLLYIVLFSCVSDFSIFYRYLNRKKTSDC